MRSIIYFCNMLLLLSSSFGSLLLLFKFKGSGYTADLAVDAVSPKWPVCPLLSTAEQTLFVICDLIQVLWKLCCFFSSVLLPHRFQVSIGYELAYFFDVDYELILFFVIL